MCGARTCLAHLSQVPSGSAQSAVMLAAEADNMWAKQVAAILDACPDIQLAHGFADGQGGPLVSSPKEAMHLIW